MLYWYFFLKTAEPKYLTLYLPLNTKRFFFIAAFLGTINATTFWFSLMWFVSGSDLMQMWMAMHLITFTVGLTLSFGISVIQAEHIPEVIYRSCQLESKAVFLVPMSTAFRAVSDSLLPSEYLSIGSRQFDSVEVFAFATSTAILLYFLFTILSWLAEKSTYAG